MSSMSMSLATNGPPHMHAAPPMHAAMTLRNVVAPGVVAGGVCTLQPHRELRQWLAKMTTQTPGL
jgi:hypothetical protein